MRSVLAAIGLTPSDAFRLMMIRVAEERSLPFDVLIPNEETVAAIKSARDGQVKSFVNLQEQDKVRSLPITDIENLAEALLDFNGIADLEIWRRENIV